MEDQRINNDIIKLHCLIPLEALCAKVSTLKSVIDIVVKGCELYFVPRVEPSSISPITFTKRDFYRDLLYFCGIRWLSRGEILRGVYTLREKIANFLEKTYKCY